MNDFEDRPIVRESIEALQELGTLPVDLYIRLSEAVGNEGADALINQYT